MPPLFKPSGPVEAVVLGIVILAAIGGAILTIVAPETLSASTYSTEVLPELTGAAALFGIGKGVRLHGTPLTLGEIEQDAPEIQAIAEAVKSKNYVQAVGLVESLAGDVAGGAPSAAETAQGPPEPAAGDQGNPAVDKPVESAYNQQAPPAPSAEQIAQAQAILAQAQAAEQPTQQIPPGVITQSPPNPPPQ